jgi:hypothetical protein
MNRCLPRSLGDVEEESAQARVSPIAASISNQDMFADELNSFMTDKIMPLSQAIEGYDIFNNMKVHKVIFEPDH